jgi:hypothetical protein
MGGYYTNMFPTSTPFSYPFVTVEHFFARIAEQGALGSKHPCSLDCYRQTHKKCYRRHPEKENERYFRETAQESPETSKQAPFKVALKAERAGFFLEEKE